MISVGKNLHETGVIFIRMGQESSGVIETLQDPGITGNIFYRTRQNRNEFSLLCQPLVYILVYTKVSWCMCVYKCLSINAVMCEYLCKSVCEWKCVCACVYQCVCVFSPGP
jgi:hypothetical protein